MTSQRLAQDDTRLAPPEVDLAVPVNHLSLAKTRLRLPPRVRESLVLAFLVDTLQAALNCPLVRTVTVVTDDGAAADAAVRAGANSYSPRLSLPSLNRDLTAFARIAADDQPLAILLADLPALTVTELTAALTECLGYAKAFAPDQERAGTTLLYTRRAGRLRPAFGKDSARTHRESGAHPLVQVGPGLRQDVDTLTDLLSAQVLGVGVQTAMELDALPDRLSLHRQFTDERPGPA